MGGFLDRFRKDVIADVWKEKEVNAGEIKVDDKIALGVLLWVVAEADGNFADSEKAKIKETLTDVCKIKDDELAVVLSAIQTAADQRIDLFTFTHEVSEDLTRDKKLEIIEHLFRVACADQKLDESENSIIRKISGLFRLDHKEYIDAKIKIKKEFGLA